MTSLDYPDFSNGLVDVANSAMVIQSGFLAPGGYFILGQVVSGYNSLSVNVVAQWDTIKQSQIEVVFEWSMKGVTVGRDVFSQFDDGGNTGFGEVYYQLPVRGDTLSVAIYSTTGSGQQVAVNVIGSSRTLAKQSVVSEARQDLLVDAWASPVQVAASSSVFYPVGPFAKGVHLNVIGPANTSFVRARVPSLSPLNVWNSTYAGGIYCTNSLGSFADLWVPNKCMLIEIGNDMTSPQLIYFDAIGIA